MIDTFQWERCNSSGASCADIPGATESTYVLTAGDVGSTIKARGWRDGILVGESSPSSVVAAATPGSGIIFSQNFEDGTWGSWQVQQAATGRAKVVSGSRAAVGGPAAARWGTYYFESEVHNGDNVLGGERCEILQGGFNQGVDGADQWMSYSVFMPLSLPLAPQTGLIGGQWHHTYDYKQSDQFGVSPNYAQLPYGTTADPHWWFGVNGGPAVAGGQDVNSTYSKAFDLGSIRSLWMGEWIDVLIHVVWKADLTGTWELWLKKASDISFTKYVDRVGNIATKVNGYTAYIKLGQNRIQSSGLPVGYAWYDNYLCGLTRADVDIF